MITQFKTLFEEGKYDDVVVLWSASSELPKQHNAKVDLYQILAITADKLQLYKLGVWASKSGMDLLIDEPLSDEKRGSMKMFGKIALDFELGERKYFKAYILIKKYDLASYWDYFESQKAHICTVLANKIYSTTSIAFTVAAFSFIFLNNKLELLSPLPSLIVYGVCVVLGLVILLRRIAVKKLCYRWLR
ncbi:hypothetical protein C900_02122 [Fulvivirga imtechensis AK7]|uniref:Uncharacterized protein n=1 Tax=Fulvivirga imtechensis AK7 TaxID=1237149 RepID=L8JXI4_9BACT|nr:hypothetical protein [Fulvivirga imtechensis]ELR71937.1 hypothetical protein C900_02122 [Fulvivirga imtechensis AK7]